MLIEQNTNVIDFVTNNYGLPALFDFMAANSGITNIESQILSGQIVIPVNASAPFSSINFTKSSPVTLTEILSNSTLIDYVSNNYGLGSLFNFIEANSGITNIEQELVSGQIITPISVPAPSIYQNNKTPFIPAIQYEGVYMQSLWDISLQQTGDISNIFDLLEANTQLGTITNTNISGIIYNYPLQNNSTTNFYSAKGINLATNLFIQTFEKSGRSFNISFNNSFD
jgi:hypothetical protein